MAYVTKNWCGICTSISFAICLLLFHASQYRHRHSLSRTSDDIRFCTQYRHVRVARLHKIPVFGKHDVTHYDMTWHDRSTSLAEQYCLPISYGWSHQTTLIIRASSLNPYNTKYISMFSAFQLGPNFVGVTRTRSSRSSQKNLVPEKEKLLASPYALGRSLGLVSGWFKKKNSRLIRCVAIATYSAWLGVVWWSMICLRYLARWSNEPRYSSAAR